MCKDCQSNIYLLSHNYSQVVVKVTNHLGIESVTIHWHGMLMEGTPWMDGPSYITQCPIPPGATFVYRFKAIPGGTHWYHAHQESQRLDGLYGLLVVHKSVPNKAEHLMTVQDWIHLDTVGIRTSLPFSSPPGSGDILDVVSDLGVDGSILTPRKFYSVIFNGRGRFDDSTGNTPLSEIVVQQGGKTRIRLVHVGADYLLRVSIDGHLIDIVASDGYDLSFGQKVNYFIINPGESIDFEITTTMSPGPYWIRANTLQASPQPDQIKGGMAILRYSNGDMTSEPTTSDWACIGTSRCSVFNCPFGAYSPIDTDCLHLTAATSTANPQQTRLTYGLDAAAGDVDEYFLKFGFVRGTPSINGRSYTKTTVPFSQRSDLEAQRIPCDSPECAGTLCRCTHIIPIDYNRTIQLVAFSTQGTHNLHLHGHNFAVVADGYSDFDPITGFALGHNPDITISSDGLTGSWTNGPPTLNTQKPPIKDTVVVPNGGYVVLRFRSLNPGPWFLHCHHEFHQLLGMALVLDEAAESQPAPPSGFPTCGNFEWTQEQFEQYIGY